MYWIDVLLLVSAIPLLGWLAYAFTESIQQNDTRGLIVWSGVIAFVAAILLVLLAAGAISI